MKSLQLVPYEFKGRLLRTFSEDGETYFVAKDACEMLGYGNTPEALRKHVHEDDVMKRDSVPDSLGRRNTQNCINESGLYALIFGSTLPAAKEFKRWVTKEVLPEIRKTGQFVSKAGIILNERSIGRVKHLFAMEIEENKFLKMKVAKLELQLILKTSKRLRMDDVERMYDLNMDIDVGSLNMTEQELARAFGMSYDRFKRILSLYDNTKGLYIDHQKRLKARDFDGELEVEDGNS